MNNIILLLFVVFTTNNINSQTNRYSEVTPASYTPSSSSGYYQRDYHAIALQRINNIKNNILYWESVVKSVLKKNTDTDFESDIATVQLFLRHLRETDGMSLDLAESYLKKVKKIYNKAVKDYNKRVKKHNKALKKQQKKMKKESKKKSND